MLAVEHNYLFNLAMSEVVDDFDPYSSNELVSYLPECCQSCNFARFIVALERIQENGALGSMEKIVEIEEQCTGYEGPDPDSEYYGNVFDRSGCPYVEIKNKENSK